jgi:environmental stress-induced protein Ves
MPSERREHLLRWADYAVVPWKNGGGVTREIARRPASSPFEWRLSMADMPTEAPFSPFAGVTRHLALVEGNGLVLTIDGEATTLAFGEVATFDGAAEVIGAPVGGPAVDLNLMEIAGRTGSLAAVSAGETPLPVGWSALVALVDGVTAGAHRLDRFDCLLVQTTSETTLLVGGSGARPVAMLARIG